MTHSKGYTLIELMVSVGLFAIIMLLASGSYLMMIGLNRQVQGISTGINNLSFALETMTRTIRTGTHYSCDADVRTGAGFDCSSGTSFFVTNSNGVRVRYDALSYAINQNNIPLTDSSSVQITSLTFTAIGTAQSDNTQPQVIITVSGTVPGKIPQSFTIKTSATMRSLDL